MHDEDHFRIDELGGTSASSLYFDQPPGLSCTCYDEGSDRGSIPMRGVNTNYGRGDLCLFVY